MRKRWKICSAAWPRAEAMANPGRDFGGEWPFTAALRGTGAIMDGRKYLRYAAAGLGLALLLALLWWLLCPIGMRIRMLQDEVLMLQRWIDGFGEWGASVFLVVYALAVVLLVPGSALAIAAGLAYGSRGVPLALFAATLGASIAFLISRYLARERMRSLTSGNALLHALERAVSEGGFKAVSLIRFSPLIPFNLQNYLFGITDIPFRLYLPATFIGILPGTVANVLIAASSVDNSGAGHGLQLGLAGFGLVVSVLVGWMIGRAVKKRMLLAQREHEHAHGAAPTPDIA
jgi:uncharacterized membrane protein YdjX (TVP38/TMEM64 family)